METPRPNYETVAQQAALADGSGMYMSESMRMALEASQTGTWAFYPFQNIFKWDALCAEMFLWDGLEASLVDWMPCVHPDDQMELSRHLIPLYTKDAQRFSILFRFTNPASGNTDWFCMRGRAASTSEGELCLAGTIQNYNEEKQREENRERAENRFQHAFDNAAVGITVLDMEGNVMMTNLAFCQMVGYTQAELINKNIKFYCHPDDYAKTMDNARKLKDGMLSHCIMDRRLVRKDNSVFWVRSNSGLILNDAGEQDGYVNIVQDISQEQEARREQQTLLSLVENSADFMSTADLHGNLLYINKAGRDLVGLSAEMDLTGMKVRELYTEDHYDSVNARVVMALNRGEHWSGTVYLRHWKTREIIPCHADYLTIYSPVTGKPIGRGATFRDLRPELATQKELIDREYLFRSLIEEAPIPTALYSGKDMIIQVANDAVLKSWGKGASVIGKPVARALPELAGQPFLDVLHHVYETGTTYHSDETAVKLAIGGVLQTFFLSFTYQPLLNSDGDVYAILYMAVDITSHVRAKRELVEAQEHLRGAIEMAKLGTWSYNPISNTSTFSERICEWHGITMGETVLEDILDTIHIEDRDRVGVALRRTLEHDAAVFNETYSVVNRLTGQHRILHAQGQSFFNNKGIPYRVSGTVQDVTVQKRTERELGQQVHDRTEELHRSYQRLEDTIVRLQQSNQELEQYAYVASHDLQEPLRKIGIFSGLLNDRTDLAEDARMLLGRIIGSSDRMSQLIKDLLEYSRLLNSENKMRTVNLDMVLREVLTDFELVIQEKEATVDAQKLRSIQAVPLQMQQLLYNLLGNALKFVADGVKPQITISCRTLTDEEVKTHVLYTKGRLFIQLAISDNGIGIDERHMPQIFEVFKRLHPRNTYAGSGIGLALCRRIAQNHGGRLFAESELGKGTTFYVILPVSRNGEDVA